MIADYVLHFPLTDFAIVLVIVGACFELAARFTSNELWDKIARAMLILGSAGIALTISSGLWLVSTTDHGGHHGDALDTHRLLGLSAGVLVLLTLMFHLARNKVPAAIAGRTVAYVLAAALTAAAAFAGGQMAHGGQSEVSSSTLEHTGHDH